MRLLNGLNGILPRPQSHVLSHSHHLNFTDQFFALALVRECFAQIIDNTSNAAVRLTNKLLYANIRIKVLTQVIKTAHFSRAERAQAIRQR